MKKLFALILALSLLALAGCGGEQAANTGGDQIPATGGEQKQTGELMDAQALRTVAYEHAGVAEADVYDVEEEWKTLPDKTLYKLDFDAKGVEYEYGINGHTGAIVYSTYEGEPEEPTAERITEDEAKRIALEHAGLTEAAVKGLRVELDREDNDYEVEFYAKGLEYDYEIDATTGAILKAEQDKD